MSLQPYSESDARRLRRGIAWSLLLAAPGWAGSAIVIAGLGWAAWPLALGVNMSLAAVSLGLLALAAE